MGTTKKILLHVCCAPCAGPCIERLQANNRIVGLFYSNSNIGSQEELEKRLKYVKKIAAFFGVPLEVDEYKHADWLDYIAGLEDEPEKGARCRKCFEFNLKRTAEATSKLGYDEFATSLTVSPQKKSADVFAGGAKFKNFSPWDFKKNDGFKRSIELSREFELYRQNFCGCEFSQHRPD
ncbi:MAG: epoxyqueuosine reductase QueH [Victivallaceae bacterium]